MGLKFYGEVEQEVNAISNLEIFVCNKIQTLKVFSVLYGQEIKQFLAQVLKGNENCEFCDRNLISIWSNCSSANNIVRP